MCQAGQNHQKIQQRIGLEDGGLALLDVELGLALDCDGVGLGVGLRLGGVGLGLGGVEGLLRLEVLLAQLLLLGVGRLPRHLQPVMVMICCGITSSTAALAWSRSSLRLVSSSLTAKRETTAFTASGRRGAMMRCSN